MKINIKAAEAAMLAGMAFSVFCAGFCGIAEERGHITNSVFRLHIKANSDSEEDQALKLKVRDAVLAETEYIFRDCASSEEAAAAAEANLDIIKSAAEKTLAENGVSCSVGCEVTKADFGARAYGNVTLPAGNYSALRINLGSAEGKNWWCVMFPPLCLPAATDESGLLRECSADFTEEELEMLEHPERYECRFYILELIEKLRSRCQSDF